jgi:toxin YoeB
MQYTVTLSIKADKDMALLEKSAPAAYNKLQILLHELAEHPRIGTGKPERLGGNRARQWSRRITDKRRLVYLIDDDKIIVLVLSVARHYDDK